MCGSDDVVELVEVICNTIEDSDVLEMERIGLLLGVEPVEEWTDSVADAPVEAIALEAELPEDSGPEDEDEPVEDDDGNSLWLLVKYIELLRER